jgi:hypothetical protein
MVMMAVVVLLGAAGAVFYLRQRRRTRSEQVSDPPRRRARREVVTGSYRLPGVRALVTGAAAAVLPAGAAGCGASGGSSAGSSEATISTATASASTDDQRAAAPDSTRRRYVAAVNRFVDCMRANGFAAMPRPDPQGNLPSDNMQLMLGSPQGERAFNSCLIAGYAVTSLRQQLGLPTG